MKDVQGRCPACGRSSLFLGAGGFVTCSRSDCAEPDAATTLLERTPAAEPEPDTERGNCQRCGNDAALTWGVCSPCFEHVDSEVRAEPVRVTLPDIRERLKQHMLDHFNPDNSGQWRLKPYDAADAILAEFTILAQPPMADPAETDAEPLTPGELDYTEFLTQMVARAEQTATARAKLYANIAADRAAKRGRDEALAGFERAVRGVEQHLSMQPHSAPIEETLRLLASAIEREQGGDGR